MKRSICEWGPSDFSVSKVYKQSPKPGFDALSDRNFQSQVRPTEATIQQSNGDSLNILFDASSGFARRREKDALIGLNQHPAACSRLFLVRLIGSQNTLCIFKKEDLGDLLQKF